MSVSIERGGVPQLHTFGVHTVKPLLVRLAWDWGLPPTRSRHRKLPPMQSAPNLRFMSTFGRLVIQLWMSMGIAGLLGDAALLHVLCHLQAPIHRR